MNDCLGQQKARLPEMTGRSGDCPLNSPHLKSQATCRLLARRPLQAPFLVRDECVPIFIRIDRHALTAFFAQPKVFATAEFTLSKS